MTKQTKYIDPYSHPSNEELPLREAAKLASEQFVEQENGESTGVRAVGIGTDRIFFYVKNKEVGEQLPKIFRGHTCEVKISGEPRPFSNIT